MSWDGELLTGEVVAKKRQAMVDRFQSGLSPLFVCTYGAGGVGITLTAACTVILVDRPWTPGDVSQAGKSALVLFYKVISCVQHEASSIWRIYLAFIWLSFDCLHKTQVLTEVTIISLSLRYL